MGYRIGHERTRVFESGGSSFLNIVFSRKDTKEERVESTVTLVACADEERSVTDVLVSRAVLADDAPVFQVESMVTGESYTVDISLGGSDATTQELVSTLVVACPLYIVGNQILYFYQDTGYWIKILEYGYQVLTVLFFYDDGTVEEVEPIRDYSRVKETLWVDYDRLSGGSR
ncbi:MAG: hypothetical protein AB1331_00205 [Bacillota bacterium]